MVPRKNKYKISAWSQNLRSVFDGSRNLIFAFLFGLTVSIFLPTGLGELDLLPFFFYFGCQELNFSEYLLN